MPRIPYWGFAEVGGSRPAITRRCRPDPGGEAAVPPAPPADRNGPGAATCDSSAADHPDRAGPPLGPRSGHPPAGRQLRCRACAAALRRQRTPAFVPASPVGASAHPRSQFRNNGRRPPGHADRGPAVHVQHAIHPAPASILTDRNANMRRRYRPAARLIADGRVGGGRWMRGTELSPTTPGRARAFERRPGRHPAPYSAGPHNSRPANPDVRRSHPGTSRRPAPPSLMATPRTGAGARPPDAPVRLPGVPTGRPWAAWQADWRGGATGPHTGEGVTTELE